MTTQQASNLLRVEDPRVREPAPGAPVAYRMIGHSDVRVWSRPAGNLVESTLRRAGIGRRLDADRLPEGECALAPQEGVLVLRADTFFDRSAVAVLSARAPTALVEARADGGRKIVAVHCEAADLPAWEKRVADGLGPDEALPPKVRCIDLSRPPVVFDYELRRHRVPLVRRLEEDTRPGIERDLFYASYKGVTDFVTKYVYPWPALQLTRVAARFGVRPNTITAFNLALVLAVTALFANASFGAGLAVAFFVSLLDTVDGKLARVTQQASRFGKNFDHGIDQVHPPFWWLAWWWGLRGEAPASFEPVLSAAIVVTVVGYVALRLLEVNFKRRFGVRIHVWERFDSLFRLVCSRRNPNLVLLALATLAGRPDVGLLLVAGWTAITLAVHGTRTFQAGRAAARGVPLPSWLESPPARA